MLRYLLDTDICSYAIKRKAATLLGRMLDRQPAHRQLG